MKYWKRPFVYSTLVLCVAMAVMTHASLKKHPNHPLSRPLKFETHHVDLRELSVEQTIGLACLPESAPWHLYLRANPLAKEGLYYVLQDEDPESYWYHGNVFRMFAYIGDNSDVDHLVKRLAGYTGLITSKQQFDFRWTMISLGILARRGNHLAASHLGKMSSLDYWQGKLKFRPDELVTSNHLFGEQEAVVCVIYAQTIACWDGVDDLRRDVAATIDDPGRRARFLSQVQPNDLRRFADEIRDGELNPVTTGDIEMCQNLYDRRERFIESFREWKKE